MERFCGKCGARLNERTGRCPNCDRKPKKGMGWVIAVFILLLLCAAVYAVIQVRRLSAEQVQATDPSETGAERNVSLEIPYGEPAVTQNEPERSPRKISWVSVSAGPTYDSYGRLTGIWCEGCFRLSPNDYSGISICNSFGSKHSGGPMYIDGAGYDYEWFGFYLPDDPSIEGWQTLSVMFDGRVERVAVKLKYLGSFSKSIGKTSEYFQGGWKVLEWKTIPESATQINGRFRVETAPISSGLYTSSDGKSALWIEENGAELTLSAWWLYGEEDFWLYPGGYPGPPVIGKAVLEQNGSMATFDFFNSESGQSASGTVQIKNKEIILVLENTDSPHIPYERTEYTWICGKITDEEMRQSAQQLRVPDNLDVEYKQYHPYYWLGADMYCTPFEVIYRGEVIAGADLATKTGGVVGAIWTYSPSHLE